MNDMQNHQPLIGRKLLLIIGAAILIAIVSFGTVFILKNVVPKNVAPTIDAIDSSIKPAEIISSFSVPGAIQDLSEVVYYRQNVNTASGLVTYTLPGRSYQVSTATDSHVLFYAKNKLDHDDTETIQKETTAFMKTKKYEKMNDTHTLAVGELPVVTYMSETGICQLTSSGASTVSLSYHTLACVTKKAVNKEYEDVQRLFNLYTTSHKSFTFTQAVRTTMSEGNKTLAILSLTSEADHPVLLFASIANNWAYIGNLNDPSGISNSKFSITPELKTVMADPKYGTFLTKNILGDTQ